MKRKDIYILLFGAIIAAILFATYFYSASREVYLSNYKNEISCFVLQNKMGSAGSRIIQFEDGLVLYISPDYKSDTTKYDQIKLKKWHQRSLNKFLQRGDSIFKRQNSDTVYVYRNDIEYIFINKFHR